MDADCKCKCSGELVFMRIEPGKQWFDFYYMCKNCTQTVVHSKIPTRHGYVVVHVHNLGA